MNDRLKLAIRIREEYLVSIIRNNRVVLFCCRKRIQSEMEIFDSYWELLVLDLINYYCFYRM